MNFGSLGIALLLAVAGTLGCTTLLFLAMRLGGRGWRERTEVVRVVHGAAALCWLVHFIGVVDYCRQYGVWPGLVAFTVASLFVAAGALAVSARSAVGLLLLGLYWLITFPLLRWRFPYDYFSTDDLGQIAIVLACGSAALFLVAYRRKD
jgi:hypothetical protein